jgi:cytochrome c-type biogenesis protein CcmH/NrfG
VTERKTVTRTGRTGRNIVVVGALIFALFASGVSSAWAQKSPIGRAAFLRAQHDLVDSDVTDAAAEMETAVRFEPRFAFGWYLLASTSRRAGDYDRAVAAYRRYLELRPSEPDPLFGIGLCLEAIGDPEGARASLQRYVELDTRAQSSEFVGQARKHIAALEAARAKPAAVAARAGGAARAGAAGAAGVLAGAGAGGAPGQAPPPPVATPLAAGAQLIAEHKFNEAIEQLKLTVKEAPADAPAWYKLAFALRESGQTTEAAKAYRRYITLKPEDPDPYYSLGQVLLSSGRPDDALMAFRTYLKTEHRPAEQRWIAKARAEVIRLESARRPTTPTEPKPIAQKPTTPPAPQPNAPETATPTEPRSVTQKAATND